MLDTLTNQYVLAPCGKRKHEIVIRCSYGKESLFDNESVVDAIIRIVMG